MSRAGLPPSAMDFLVGAFPAGGFALEPLKGDASDRDYCRVRFEGSSPRGARTAVLMHVREPGSAGARAFVQTRRILESAGVPVPALITNSPDGRFFLLEDFGDVTLEGAVAGREDSPECERLYSEALEILLKIQFKTLADKDSSLIPFQLAFDEEKLTWELEFFLENVVGTYMKETIASGDGRFIREEFGKIVSELASEPRYLAHRDYHGRNLMVRDDGRIGVLDFQDARMGPLQYDLVSLLCDSYVSLPAATASRLKERYIGSVERSAGLKVERARFERVFLLVKVQRSLKAAGSFAYLDCVKKLNRYVRHLPAALSHAFSAMDALELDGLKRTLTKYVGSGK
ncbi:MAG: phosphotransferase [bacterium]